MGQYGPAPGRDALLCLPAGPPQCLPSARALGSQQRGPVPADWQTMARSPRGGTQGQRRHQNHSLGNTRPAWSSSPRGELGGPYRPPIPRVGPVSLWPQLCGAPRRLIATDVKLLQPRRKHDSGEIFLKILYIFIKALTTPKCSALFPSLPPGGGQRRWSNRHHRGNGPTVPLTFDRWPQAHLPLASGGLWPGHP